MNPNNYTEKRYFAIFKHGAMEVENRSDNPRELKVWVADLLEDFPSPDYVYIRDQKEEKDIFSEKNE